jgi:NAD+ diphosphatase
MAHFVVLHGPSALFEEPPKEEEGISLDEALHQNRRLRLLNRQQVDSLCEAAGASKQTTFLGLMNDCEPVFGVDILYDEDNKKKEEYAGRLMEIALSKVLSKDHPAVFENTRTVAPLLDPTTNDNELIMHAMALAQWQRRAPHCMVCGSVTNLVEGGTSRKCPSCGDRSWPRQDPSMIVAISSRCGNKLLLGRSKRHPSGVHSTLAGFVEAGESMERAVAREVFEETGIRINEDTVQYVASQPWPFPQSTMIGFICTADENQLLNIDENELAGAAWFDKDQVRLASTIPGPVMQREIAEAALTGNPDLSLLIPPKGVIARVLIDKWLSQ